jgi:menaquinone-9 beta-reductase
MTRQVDIAGGGVAGLALGLALRRAGVPVCLHEAGAYPRHRLCGEFLSGVGEKEFEELGLAAIPAQAEVLREAAWFSGNRMLLRSKLPEPAFGISRWRLDAAMAAQLAAEGGVVNCEDRVPQAENSEGWVWATGRPVAKDGPWYGEKEHYTAMETSVGVEMHLGSGGYAGVAHIGNGVVNVCALLPARAGKLSNATLAGRLHACGLTSLARRLENARAVPGSRCGAPRFQTGWQSSGNGCLCIGDNAAVIAPFSGHGMGMGILAALAAAPFLTAWSAGRISWSEAVRATEAAMRRKFRTRLRWASWLHPLLLRPGGRFFLQILLRTGLDPSRWLYQKMR